LQSGAARAAGTVLSVGLAAPQRGNGGTPPAGVNPSQGDEVMADINVERKQRSIWPWIVGLLVLALLIWLLASMFNDDDDAVVVDETTVEAPATTP
jgi:hypothetical protein